MAGMEINAGEPFDTVDRTVTQLITWLQSQDQNAVVRTAEGETLLFRRLRNKDGGGIRVEVVAEEKPKEPKSKVEKALTESEVSAADDPAKAHKVIEGLDDNKPKSTSKK